MKKTDLDKLRKRVLTSTSMYDLLAVPPNATDDQIKIAHRLLASAFHPDRCKLDDASALMAVVNVAYNTLSDPKQRSLYDTVNHIKLLVCSKCDGTGTVYKQKGFKARVKATCPICGGSGRG